MKKNPTIIRSFLFILVVVFIIFDNNKNNSTVHPAKNISKEQKKLPGDTSLENITINNTDSCNKTANNPEDPLWQSNLDSLRYMHNINNFQKLRKQNQFFLQEIKRLDNENQHLLASNQQLSAASEKLSNQFTSLKKSFSDDTEPAAPFSVGSATATGIEADESGKENVTNKVNKANKIKICFTLPANAGIDSKIKTFYVVIADQGGSIQLSGTDKIFDAQDGHRHYSSKIQYNYDAEQATLCTYASCRGALKKGRYTVTIYCGRNKTGSTSFSLK